jgi:hypothetical protein
VISILTSLGLGQVDGEFIVLLLAILRNNDKLIIATFPEGTRPLAGSGVAQNLRLTGGGI